MSKAVRQLTDGLNMLLINTTSKVAPGMIFKISVRLEEPLKMRTKVKIDSNNLPANLPFESLIVQAKPNDPEGNYFEIRLNTPRTTILQEPKDKQNGLIRNLWQTICHSQPKQKPSPPQSHIIMTEEHLYQRNNISQGGEVYEKNEDPKTENSETGS